MSQVQATERINLTLEDSQNNVIELPFRILVISDLTCDERSAEFAGQSLLSAEDGIDTLLGKQRIRAQLRVQDCLSGSDSELLVTFEPHSMEDFHPDFLLQDVPVINEVYELYRQLADSSVRSNRLVEPLAELGLEFDESDLDETTRLALISDIELRLSSQLDAIIQHPTFKTLEASWRGLEFLVQQVNFNENTEISVLNLSKTALAEDFEDAPDVTRSTLYQQVYSKEYGQFGGRPFGLIIGDFQFNPHQQDIVLLRNIASVAASAHTPFISAAHARFFSIDDFNQFSKIRDLDAHFDQPALAKWNSFRQLPESRFIGLALPRFLLRENYTDDGGSHFPYKEKVNRKQKGGCWGNAAFAVASRFANSFAQFRWFVNVTGEDYGIIPELEVRHGQGAHRTQIPTEVMVTDRSEAELVRLGFIPITIHKTNRKAVILSMPSCCGIMDSSNKAAELDQRLENQLPYIFISCRFSQYLKVMQRENLGAWHNRSQLENEMNRWLKQYVSDMDNPTPSVRARRPLRHARITVRESEHNPSWYLINIVLTPHLKYMGRSFTLTSSGKLEKT